MLLGILSGIPLALTGSTLSMFLTQSGIDIKTIGLFATVGIPYSFKFLWAPILDNLCIPFLSSMLGRRRSQLLLVSTLLALAVSVLGQISPESYILYTAITAITVAFFSASQDIIIDALRIEILKDDEQAAGASMIVNGYRLGMIVSSAGCLYLATFTNWGVTYFVMSLILVALAVIGVLMHSEAPYNGSESKLATWGENFVKSFIEPVKDIYSRTRFGYLILFIIFFKLSDALLMSLSTPFLVHVGFSMLDIANVSKTFGIIATIVGGLIGGYMGNKMSPISFVRIALILEMVSNLSYLLLVHYGNDMNALFAVVATENICSGISTAALVAYMSRICNKSFTASQYAALSALAAFGRSTISGSSGFVMDAVGWEIFFIITACASLPALVLSKFVINKESN